MCHLVRSLASSKPPSAHAWITLSPHLLQLLLPCIPSLFNKTLVSIMFWTYSSYDFISKEGNPPVASLTLKLKFAFLTMVYKALRKSAPPYHSDLNSYHSFFLAQLQQHWSNSLLLNIPSDLHFHLPLCRWASHPQILIWPFLSFFPLSFLGAFSGKLGVFFTHPSWLPPLPADFLYPMPLHYFYHRTYNLNSQSLIQMLLVCFLSLLSLGNKLHWK